MLSNIDLGICESTENQIWIRKEDPAINGDYLIMETFDEIVNNKRRLMNVAYTVDQYCDPSFVLLARITAAEKHKFPICSPYSIDIHPSVFDAVYARKMLIWITNKHPEAIKEFTEKDE